jgi:hypothetical protein
MSRLPRASDAAREEAELWMSVIRSLDHLPHGAAVTEAMVTGSDPAADLDRRARKWSHSFERRDLSEVCAFATGLALAEAEAWDSDEPSVATRSHEDRRFLAGDRIIWWAVPWAIEVDADIATRLLDLGDRLRVAPSLGGREGLVAPGEDSLGPLEPERPFDEWLRSVLSGIALNGRRPTAPLYLEAADRWRQLADARPGTARLWLDLAERAEITAGLLSKEPTG